MRIYVVTLEPRYEAPPLILAFSKLKAARLAAKEYDNVAFDTEVVSVEIDSGKAGYVSAFVNIDKLRSEYELVSAVPAEP